MRGAEVHDMGRILDETDVLDVEMFMVWGYFLDERDVHDVRMFMVWGCFLDMRDVHDMEMFMMWECHDVGMCTLYEGCL